MKKLHLLTNDIIDEGNEVLTELGLIPLFYKGNVDLFDKQVDNIFEKHPAYENIIQKIKKSFLQMELLIINYYLMNVDQIPVYKIIINI